MAKRKTRRNRNPNGDKIRAFCRANPDVRGKDVLVALKLPATKQNLMTCYGVRNYLNKHKQFQPADVKPETKQTPPTDTLADVPREKFYQVTDLCYEIGAAKIVAIGRMMQTLEGRKR